MTDKKKRSKQKNWLEGLNPDAFYRLINSNRLYGYREFCRVLEIPIASSGSNSQLKQLNMINMLCEYEKEGSKFKFIRVRNEQDIEVFQEQLAYTQLFKYSLMRAFSQEDFQKNIQDGMLFITMPKLMEMCGMVNRNFGIFRNASEHKKWVISMVHKNEFGKGIDSYNNLKHFVDVAYDVIKPIIRNALKSMDNEHSITIHKGYVLYKELDNGVSLKKRVIKGVGEGEEVFKICGDVLSELNIEKMNDLYFGNPEKIQQFYGRCNELCKERLGYDGFYDCYAINTNPKRIEYLLNVNYAQALNDKVKEKLDEHRLLEEIGNKFKKNLISATTDINTTYDFNQDYEIATQKE
jgi:hypothetical protein